MTNEIKVGDKVRVREDAPKVYLRGWGKAVEYNVYAVDGDAAIITYGHQEIAIPLKYLIKVEDEAKEAKFKVGDVVRIKADADKLHQGYQNGYAWLPERDDYLGRVASVKEIWCDGSLVLNIAGNMMWVPIDLEPYAEPADEKNLQDATASELRDLANHGVPVGDEVKRRIKEREKKPNVGKITIPVEADLTESFWDAYTADLAKEIALKVANKYNDPKETAEYAVLVAKAVAEGLKKK